jgi:hypothetical protein
LQTWQIAAPNCGLAAKRFCTPGYESGCRYPLEIQIFFSPHLAKNQAFFLKTRIPTNKQ